MGYRAPARFFPSSVALRSLLAACFAFAFLEVLTGTPYYATAFALGGLALLIAWDASRLENSLLAAISEQSPRQERHLREMERATALLDAVTVALVAVGDDGRIQFANRAARKLAGTDPGRLADFAILAPDSMAEILALAPGARRILPLADGRLALVWVVGLTLAGAPPQKLVSLQIVAGELDAVQLRAWQDMTRVLAHEIMNSLTPIASLSESAAALIEARGTPACEVSRAVTTIARRSVHLLDFVERYRDIAEMPDPRMRPILAADLIAEIEAVLQPDFAARGVAYSSAIDPPGFGFEGDPELLSQALLNLVRNALDAVAAVDEPRIELTCERIGAEIACGVTDNGPGIPADRLQEIFVPFFTTKPAGSGIGLTLAHQIALAHGGRIEASNRDGGGAHFRMSIPARSWPGR